MKELQDLIDKLLRPVETWAVGANEALIGKVRGLLNTLDVNRAGAIKPTVANAKKLNRVNLLIREVFATPAYKKVIGDLSGGLKEVAEVTNSYFRRVFDLPRGYSDKALFTYLTETAVESTRVELLAPTLPEAVLMSPGTGLKAVIEAGLTNGSTVESLIKSVEASLVRGGQPLLRSYAAQIGNDAVTQFGRNYINAYAQDLGLEWYLYEGKPIATSRAFCTARANKYFHKSEIESWADQTWQGKNPATNSATIFSLVGGYNCRHFLIPVTANSVPEEVKARIAGA